MSQGTTAFVKMVDVWRGPLVESQHVGAAVVANSAGEIIAGWGDTGLVTYPRSALKPVQAIALVESGAFAAARLTERHLAIACASHRAEAFHSTLVASWLAQMQLGQEALICGPDRPADEAAASAAIIEGHARQRIFHNCSGKHCGFLALSLNQGWSIDDYDQLGHPSQQRYLDALSELIGHDAAALPFGVDGCGLPAPALPLSEMAVLMARFAQAQVAAPGRREAIHAIHAAMRAHPELVSGTGQPGVLLARATRGRIVLKTGAEGFMAAWLPGQGLGVALKIADGEMRARMPALIAVLAAVGLLDADEQRALAPLAAPDVLNSAGVVVGRIHAPALT
jgi:L-asparaginase II